VPGVPATFPLTMKKPLPVIAMSVETPVFVNVP
jgi:hypothetical protein